MADCLKEAIKYATKYGWAVFPVSPTTKKPLTPHGCKDAKKSVGAIQAWWKKWPDAGIGIATGSMSNLIVIDEDVDDDKGLDGRKSVREWERENGELPETVMAITGRGGNHLYYHYAGSDLGNRGGILDGVDIRGEGGYVIAPPSLHPNGTEYQWEYHPDDYQLAELDETVLKFLKPSAKSGQGESFHLPERIQSGKRNDTLYKMACSLQAQGMPDAAIMAAVQQCNQDLCDDPLEEDEISQIVRSALTHKKGELKLLREGMPEWHEPKLKYRLDKNGDVTDVPAQTIANAEEAIMYDPGLFGRLRWNELAYSTYVYGSLPWQDGKGWREWGNMDDSNLRSYIEDRYGLKSSEKTMDALQNVASKFPFNPVIEMLETCAESWDGNKYIDTLLPRTVGAEPSEYTAEALKVFMLGAISRAYTPGCKFDYMLVLVGKQGLGKSTFFRFLAMNDAWYNDNFSTLDSDHAIEKLRGMWIVELAELQATKRAKDVETIKSFITSRTDVYRAPYNRRTEQRKRRCVLGGTSNPVDFLTDKTGNRRFLPITCGVVKPEIDMLADEQATKYLFAQAWGEAMDIYKRAGGKPKLILPAHMQKKALEMQTEYQEEDPMVGMIQDWLDKATNINRVCVMMLWRDALGNDEYNTIPDRRIINYMHDIMKNSIVGWRYIGKQYFAVYGTQRCYEREENPDFVEVKDSDIVDFG